MQDGNPVPDRTHGGDRERADARGVPNILPDEKLRTLRGPAVQELPLRPGEWLREAVELEQVGKCIPNARAGEGGSWSACVNPANDPSLEVSSPTVSGNIVMPR